MFFTDPTRASTLLLTALMVIGLVFFIRASTKDRIEVMQFGSTQAAEPLQQDVMKHFQRRAYQQIEAPATEDNSDASSWTTDAITVAGLVSPSVFMAIFLSVLAAIGFACLALVMSVLFPSWGKLAFISVAISPLAGVFYWRKSSRPEKVTFKVETSTSSQQELSSRLIVKGHRDELAELKEAFLPVLRAWQP
ncbi:MAG: cofactor assembly of complex C subunit B [Cyanobacteria bacterium P01_D01_bin.36]